MNTHGPIAWDDDTSYGNKEKRASNKDLFLKLKEGSNVVRIVTLPYQYLVHKGVKREGEPGFGRKVPCSQKYGSCPLCALNSVASPRYYIGVIDRADNRYRVLDVSWSTMQDIKGFNNDKIWGEPTKYDINIIKDPKNPQKYYTVRPNPHTPLSTADQQIRDTADLADLEYKSTPLTTEVVQKIVDKILQGGTLAPPVKDNERSAKPNKSTPVAKTKAAPVVEMSNTDDVDDIFPDYSTEVAETV
jgi:hypothetical protein